jgi:hypothetical protein
VLACAGRAGAAPDASPFGGLTAGHAYTVLSAVNVSGQCLIRMRDRWGRAPEIALPSPVPDPPAPRLTRREAVVFNRWMA